MSEATLSAEALNQIQKRRTFAIISHPDAGKTTLTEKLLLYGGAIRQAGSVKARKAERHATSDWMEIEKQRGISVTSSVMQFQHGGYCINILDTPGHQDFSEDTYRTLMAADSAVMVIDGAKGVEPQTRKLFKVCALRNIPIFTFINKMDRETRDPLELCEEVERELGIDTYPVNWPIGCGKEFAGVYDRDKRCILHFTDAGHAKKAGITEIELDDPALVDLIGQSRRDTLAEEVELLGAGRDFDLDAVRHGKLSPVFFGSALTNFGVEPFLEGFLRMTTAPLSRESDAGVIDAFSPDFSAFVFKIQANMNKAHRDRLAFMRICSGVFTKGMTVWHSGSGKMIQLKQPQQFMADEREAVENAYPGDIIGLFDPGIFALGDSLCTGKKRRFPGIPMFAPEFFARVSSIDSLKRKQFVKGVLQLSEEGAIQTFKRPGIGFEEIIVGVVGVLQFEVLEHRLKTEYNAEIRRQQLPYRFVRWITKSPKAIEDLKLSSTSSLAKDARERDVILFENEWSIRWALENNEGLELAETASRLG